MPIMFIAAAMFACVVVVVYTVASHSEERATVRDSLRQLDGYEVTDVRDRQLLNPVSERVVLPFLQGLTSLGRRFTPAGYVEKTRKKLVITGKPKPADLDRFLAVRVVTIAAVPVTMLLWYTVLPLTGQTRLLTLGLVVLGLVLGPDAILNRHMVERQDAIRKALPDILDLLTISVEAGLGFEQALDRTVQAVPGPLSDEFVRMLNEVRAGSSRSEAMRAIDTRTDVTEVRSFVLAILQADTFGVSIGRILRAQADEMRVKRRQLAQERAQKAPVKMLIPMVFCIFPALFVVVIGPAGLNVYHGYIK